jgi:hypothetical protein
MFEGLRLIKRKKGGHNLLRRRLTPDAEETAFVWF